MKVRAVFDSETKVLELIPESEGEQLLLGSVISEKVRGFVEVKREGHASFHKASIVRVTLKEID